MSAKSFLPRTLAFCVVIGVAATVLAAVNTLQAPRLRAVEFNPQALTESDSARVVLRLTQAVLPVNMSDVETQPSIPVSVRTEESAVVITFGERLNYTETVKLRVSVTSAATGIGGSLEKELSAPDVRVATLVRDDSGDRILKNDLVGGGSPSDTPIRGRVGEYAVLPGRTFAILETGPDSVELGEFTDPGGDYAQILPSAVGSLRHLRADATGLFLGAVADGITVGPAVATGNLLLFDVRGGVAPPLTIADADGTALQVTDWRFVPGSLAVVVLTEQGEVWLAAPVLDRDPVRLGPADSLIGFLPGSGELAVQRAAHVVAIDLSAPLSATGVGSWERLLLPAAPGADAAEGIAFVAGDVALVRDETRASVVALGGGGATGEHANREVFRPASDGSRVGQMCVSPNGSVVAIEVLSAGALPDGRSHSPGFTQVTTSYVSVTDGRVLRSSIGFAPDWCS